MKAVFLFEVLAVMLLNLLQMTNTAITAVAPPVAVPAVGDLRGKMFTLSPTDTVTFKSPLSSPYTSTTSHGVSVCLRYIAEGRKQTIFTLSPSSRTVDNQLKFEGSSSGYVLAYQKTSIQHTLNFLSFRGFWDNESSTKLWTSICVVVDTKRGVAQVFNGKTASVRKRLPTEYTWDGEQSLAVKEFEGQITDIQMWDYPLPDAEAKQYLTQIHSSLLQMNPQSAWTWTRPSIVSWSRLRHESRTGRTALLEEAYPMK